MINYGLFINEKVRVITMVLFRNGRKINTHYIGHLVTYNNVEITLKELDGTQVVINRKHIKRIEKLPNKGGLK